MKLLKISIILLSIVGCSAFQPYYSYNVNEFNGEPSIITSKVKASTATKIVERWFGRIPTFNPVFIYELDETPGPYNHIFRKNTYNDVWNHNAKIVVKPGLHKLLVGPNLGGDLSDPRETISFFSVEGHTYYLGCVINILNRNEYQWEPVIVDMSSESVVYPKSLPWVF